MEWNPLQRGYLYDIERLDRKRLITKMYLT